MRCSPAQAREAGVVAVRGDPLGAGLDGQGREPGVLDEVAGNLGAPAEIVKNAPVPGCGLNHLAVGLFQQHVGEGEGVREAAGASEDAENSLRADRGLGFFAAWSPSRAHRVLRDDRVRSQQRQVLDSRLSDQ